MIVKNEAQTLGPCLQSVSGIVSQIVVADTGSTDSTADIARQNGATVISIPWRNHFANARNAALDLMQTDWVLVLDADEELDTAAKSQIANLLTTSHADGYLVPIRNYIPTVTGRGWDRIAEVNKSSHPRAKTAPAYFVHENCRLFRRDPGIYFVGRVHELVEPRINALGRRLPMAPFFIHHFGQLAQEETRNHVAHQSSGAAQRSHGLGPARAAGVRMFAGRLGGLALLRARLDSGTKGHTRRSF